MAARRYALAALGAVAVVWAVVLTMVAHVDKPAVPIAGAIDLTATCTAAVYFLAVRRGHLPRWVRVVADELRVIGFALAGVFVGLTLVEAPVAHLVLAGIGHPVAAWIATALSLYGMLWLVGDALAMRHGGVIVHPDALELRIGVRWRGRIPRAAIENIARGTATEGVLDVSIVAPNVVVTLREPCTLRGLLGRRRTATRLALSIDGPDRFVTLLQ